MSDDYFDSLAKAAASTTSRRQSLKLLAGGLLGAFLFASRPGTAGAVKDCLDPGLSCTSSKQCCDIAKSKDKKELAKVKTCCCSTTTGDEKESTTTVVCTPIEVCVALGGTCLPNN